MQMRSKYYCQFLDFINKIKLDIKTADIKTILFNKISKPTFVCDFSSWTICIDTEANDLHHIFSPLLEITSISLTI